MTVRHSGRLSSELRVLLIAQRVNNLRLSPCATGAAASDARGVTSETDPLRSGLSKRGGKVQLPEGLKALVVARDPERHPGIKGKVVGIISKYSVLTVGDSGFVAISPILLKNEKSQRKPVDGNTFILKKLSNMAKSFAFDAFLRWFFQMYSHRSILQKCHGNACAFTLRRLSISETQVKKAQYLLKGGGKTFLN